MENMTLRKQLVDLIVLCKIISFFRSGFSLLGLGNINANKMKKFPVSGAYWPLAVCFGTHYDRRSWLYVIYQKNFENV